MLPIGYFLLLFFCVSANVVHSMEEEQPEPFDTAVTMLLALKDPTSLNPIQKLPSPLKTDNPDDYRFTLECPSCRKKLATTTEHHLKFDFKRHYKLLCPLTHELICPLSKIEIDQALKKIVKAKKIRRFSVPCPFEGCTFVSKINRRKSELRLRLLAHLDSQRHSNNPEKAKKRKLIATNENFKEYFDEFGTIWSIPNPNFASNPNKKRKLQHSNNC